MTRVECVLDAKAELGECPVWAAEGQELYWVDIRAPALNRLDPATGTNRIWPMPSSIGSFGLRAAGGAVVALRDGFYLFDFDTGTLSFLAAPPERLPRTRFNDGKVCRTGGSSPARWTRRSCPADREALPAGPGRHGAPDDRRTDRLERVGLAKSARLRCLRILVDQSS